MHTKKKTKNTQWTGKAWGLQNIGSTRASTTSTKTKHGWHTLTPLGPQKHIQFCTDPLPNSLALGIPQPIRFIWDPQNCTTYVYTDFALSPTNHHNQKQNMPLPSKMNKIHIKSLNSQHIEYKSSQSKAKHAITKQNEQNSYKIIEFTTYWMKMVQIALI